MIVGILKEIKVEENRVCMTPAGTEIMNNRGHEVLVESDAGVGSGFGDDDYIRAGAEIATGPEEVYAK
ncbi:MAG: alanine dehydrogenase, partial [Geopsychrobacter sp.]|nr:alanine dehydrogenase [Geopsychrobacter sp.]